MLNHSSLNDFYRRNAAPLPEGIEREIVHFNVFETEKLFDKATGARIMPYSRREYYTIGWMRGSIWDEDADRSFFCREDGVGDWTAKFRNCSASD